MHALCQHCGWPDSSPSEAGRKSLLSNDLGATQKTRKQTFEMGAASKVLNRQAFQPSSRATQGDP